MESVVIIRIKCYVICPGAGGTVPRHACRLDAALTSPPESIWYQPSMFSAEIRTRPYKEKRARASGGLGASVTPSPLLAVLVLCWVLVLHRWRQRLHGVTPENFYGDCPACAAETGADLLTVLWLGTATRLFARARFVSRIHNGRGSRDSSPRLGPFAWKFYRDSGLQSPNAAMTFTELVFLHFNDVVGATSQMP